MTEQLIRCENCGTTWSPQRSRSGHIQAELSSPVCPVCHLSVAESTHASAQVTSIADLEMQLDVLVRGAWASGIDTDAIVHVLRDELALAAEMRHTGRRIAIQIIDLGPQERELLQRPMRDQREMLANRRREQRLELCRKLLLVVTVATILGGPSACESTTAIEPVRVRCCSKCGSSRLLTVAVPKGHATPTSANTS